jgi:diacylglycerol O-acyltransferase / wax synthase
MSPAEALMWRISSDPWLRPVAGSLAVVDQPIDAGLFRRRLRHAVAEVARLRERVAPGGAPWDPPRWVVDRDFDLDYHLRHIALPGEGSEQQLREVASRLYEDPFDPARPLWQFVIVDGVEGQRGALFSKLHHSISDGIGLLRLSERYIDLDRSAPHPPDVDLEALISRETSTSGGAPLAAGPAAAVVAGPAAAGSPPRLPWPLYRAVRVARLAGWPLEVARKAVTEAASLTFEPQRAAAVTGQLLSALRTAAGPLDPGHVPGPVLWGARSSRRHLEAVRVPLSGLKTAGQALGGSVNDAFVAGAVNAVLAYQRRLGRDPQALNFSFVVSQREGRGAGGNFFTPVRVHLPVGPASATERVLAVRDAMAARRRAVQSGASLANAVALAQLLPESVLSRVARSQVAGLDFATSNLRGAPVPLYIAGARVLYNLSMGPLAGTAFNLTTISYDGTMDMGLLVDPSAVEDPGALRVGLEEAYQELIDAGT